MVVGVGVGVVSGGEELRCMTYLAELARIKLAGGPEPEPEPRPD